MCSSDLVRAEMSRRLARGDDAIVAPRAGSRRERVIEFRRCPGKGRMAGIALRGGYDVVGGLTGCDGAIVARRASARDLGVIDADGRPAGGDVTILAERRRGDVIGRLAHRRRAVVTADAGAGDLGVVDVYGCPVDSDHDGVPDFLDRCPATPAGSPVNETGCVVDSDGDGLVNVLDPDSDNDGLLDGTETGVTDPGEGTDLSKGRFTADADPSTPTEPLNRDSDEIGRAHG